MTPCSPAAACTKRWDPLWVTQIIYEMEWPIPRMPVKFYRELIRHWRGLA